MQDVRTPVISTPTDCEVRITRVFDAPRGTVWEAWTSPGKLSRWLLGPPGWSMPVCDIDLRPGGDWHFVWRRADGSEMAMSGTYREVLPPKRLVHTERWGGDWPETLCTLVLTEDAGRTTAALTILYPSKQARDRALQTGMADGVAQSYERLDRILAQASGA